MITFQEDDKLSGLDGCNIYSGDYVLDDSNISIANVLSTRLQCDDPEGIMEQEARYLELLKLAKVYQLNDFRLELLSAEGQVLIAFTTSQP